jgi:capsular exopolysaccharide synthesis family protein
MIKLIKEYTDFFDIGDLKFYLLIAKRNIKNLLSLSLLFSIIIYFVSLNIEKKFLSTATLVIAPDENKIVNIEEAYSFESIQNRVNNQIAILKSEEVLDYVVEDEKNQLEFKNLYANTKRNIIGKFFSKTNEIDKEFIKEILRKNLVVKNLPRSDVLQLSFTSNNPKISQLALKNIIDSYQRYEIDSKVQITNYANSKIIERLEELTIVMDEADKKLAKYKRDNDLVDTGNVKELKIKEIQSISNRILDAKQKYQEQQNDLLSIKIAEGDVDALLAIEDLNTRDEISNMKNSLSANDSSIESLLLIYTEKHPKVTQAYDQKSSFENQLKKILNETIEKKAFELSNLKNFLNLSNQELDKAKKELREIEEKEAGMMKFVREVESSRKLYETFLQRVKETNEAQNLQVSKMKVIESPSYTDQPFTPRPNRNFILAFIFSLIALYGLVCYRELNSTIKITQDTLNSLGVFQIGILPRVEKLKKGFHVLQLFIEDSSSIFSENIRSIRTTIESKFDKNSSYVITSSNPSEGKTTFAFNLALSLEKSYKVLFIEADIRRPSVLNGFYKFDDREILGLGEIISGEELLKNCIFKVPGTDLDIISSGKRRYDMSDIVSKDQIKKFFDLLKIEYDYVIIDSPPIQPVSDTLILTQASDYNLFVIRSEETKTASFLSSLKKIQNVEAKVDGIIINDLDTSKDSYYNYYNNYSYQYSVKN